MRKLQIDTQEFVTFTTRRKQTLGNKAIYFKESDARQSQMVMQKLLFIYCMLIVGAFIVGNMPHMKAMRGSRYLNVGILNLSY